MRIRVEKKTTSEITFPVLYFLAGNFGWSVKNLDEQDEKYGSIPYGFVLAYEKEKIIGVVALFRRTIKVKNQRIKFAGLGVVCTHKKHRKKGIAMKMLKKALKVLKDDKHDVALLCANLDTTGKLYEKVGFIPLGYSYIYTGKSGKTYKEDQGMIRVLNSKEKFDFLRNLNEEFSLEGQNW